MHRLNSFKIEFSCGAHMPVSYDNLLVGNFQEVYPVLIHNLPVPYPDPACISGDRPVRTHPIALVPTYHVKMAKFVSNKQPILLLKENIFP